MRILHVFKTYFPETSGGMERVIRSLCEYSVQNGHDASVATLSKTPPFGVLQPLDKHHYVAWKRDLDVASTGFSWGFLKSLKSLAADFDLIHYHFPWPFADLVHFSRAISKPYIVTYHADVVRQAGLLRLYMPLQHLFLAKASAIAATSTQYADTSATLARYRSEIIPLGIEETQYPAPFHSSQVAPYTQGEKPYFLCVGVYRHYKGFEHLIDLADRIEATIVIAAGGPNVSRLRAYATERGSRNSVILENVSEAEKMALLENCAAFLFPSLNRAEAYGLSLVEASMKGKPIVSYDVGSGTSFVNLHEKTGFVVPAKDEHSFLSSCKRLLADEDLREQMGQEARDRFEQKLTADHMGKSYLALYRKVLAV